MTVVNTSEKFTLESNRSKVDIYNDEEFIYTKRKLYYLK